MIHMQMTHTQTTHTQMTHAQTTHTDNTRADETRRWNTETTHRQYTRRWHTRRRHTTTLHAQKTHADDTNADDTQTATALIRVFMKARSTVRTSNRLRAVKLINFFVNFLWRWGKSATHKRRATFKRRDVEWKKDKLGAMNGRGRGREGRNEGQRTWLSKLSKDRRLLHVAQSGLPYGGKR